MIFGHQGLSQGGRGGAKWEEGSGGASMEDGGGM